MTNWREIMDQLYIKIYKKLYDYYGPQNWWPADTPFEVIISAILVQNTNWSNVELSLKKLKSYLTPEKLESLTEEKLAQLIRSSGYYNVKAKRIKAFLSWFKTYDYQFSNVEKDHTDILRQELLNIHGIGQETADVILLYVFNLPVFIADSYARRLFKRIGMNVPSTYDGLRKRVEKIFPTESYLLNEYHALLVTHSKTHCKKKPICDQCPIRDICEQHLID